MYDYSRNKKYPEIKYSFSSKYVPSYEASNL